jgi:hypothetical protein
MEIEGRNVEIERITEVYYELKRQNDLFKTTLETQRYESEKIIFDLKEKHKSEIN